MGTFLVPLEAPAFPPGPPLFVPCVLDPGNPGGGGRWLDHGGGGPACIRGRAWMDPVVRFDVQIHTSVQTLHRSTFQVVPSVRRSFACVRASFLVCLASVPRVLAARSLRRIQPHERQVLSLASSFFFLRTNFHETAGANGIGTSSIASVPFRTCSFSSTHLRSRPWTYLRRWKAAVVAPCRSTTVVLSRVWFRDESWCTMGWQPCEWKSKCQVETRRWKPNQTQDTQPAYCKHQHDCNAMIERKDGAWTKREVDGMCEQQSRETNREGVERVCGGSRER